MLPIAVDHHLVYVEVFVTADRGNLIDWFLILYVVACSVIGKASTWVNVSGCPGHQALTFLTSRTTIPFIFLFFIS